MPLAKCYFAVEQVSTNRHLYILHRHGVSASPLLKRDFVPGKCLYGSGGGGGVGGGKLKHSSKYSTCVSLLMKDQVTLSSLHNNHVL
jgi:hypothetical protein